MNSKNGQISDPHRLVFNLVGKAELQGRNVLSYQVLVSAIDGK